MISHSYDIVVRRARLRGRADRLWDLGIAQGRIEAVEERLCGQAGTEIDAAGNLVTESFVNPHIHLCKAYTRQMLDNEDALEKYSQTGDLMAATQVAARIKERYDESWIVKNARRAVALAALYGTTHLRGFADVDPKARMEGVKALLRVREEFRGIVDVQVTTYPQEGIVREPGTSELVHQAMELGADVVGGYPWIEYTEADVTQHVREVFDIAQQFGRDVSMMVDDAGDPGARSLEMTAVEAVKRGWHGRTLAHQARAMALYPKPYLEKVVGLVKKAKIGLVVNPHNAVLHAPVKELLAQGVLVCLGQDDISNAYYPYGRNNMLEVAFLASHLMWMTTGRDMETLYDMITCNAAQALGLKDHGLRVGGAAHLVVLGVPSVLEALRAHAAPAHIISHGKMVDRAAMEALGEPTPPEPMR